jgi:predicted nucleotide-binding protein
MKESMLMSGLAKYLINAVTKDGGWDAEPGSNKETNPLNTAEVLCGLISARSRLCLSGLPANYDETIRNAVKYLRSTQLASGGWSTGSTYRQQGVRDVAKGNTVSTCFALWAQILSYDLIEKEENLTDVIHKVISFLANCRDKSGRCYYSPGLADWSPISTAYILLSYSLILSWDSTFSLLTRVERLEVSQEISNILESTSDTAVMEGIKDNCISAILIYYSILLLPDTREIAAILRRKSRDAFKSIIDHLSLEQCTEVFTESQVIREDGRSKRDFTHYVPVWMLILYSQSDIAEKHFGSQVLNSVIKNVHDQADGVALSGKRWTWATGLTMFALSHYFSNIDVDMLIKKEGVQMVESKKVFVVYGRDLEFKKKIFSLLRALSLQPLGWEQVVQLTEKATPTTYEVINKGFDLAQSIVVLLSGDDVGKLKEEFYGRNDDDLEKTLSPQPRLNVVFEAGLAFGMNPDRTIVVRKSSDRLRKISDVDGFNYVDYDGSPEKRHALAGRLITAGCSVDQSGTDWLSV